MSAEIKLIGALEGLQELDEESVDMILTDPAYDTLEKWREMGTTTRLKDSKSSSNAWFPTVPPSYIQEVIDRSYKVLARNSHMYIMCDEETADNLKPMLRESGFHLLKSLIWHKIGKPEDVKCPQCGHHVLTRNRPGAPGMGYPYRSQYEMILVAEKGKRKPPENRGVRNVLSFPYLKGNKYYPTQKPVDLLKVLIQQSSFEGDLIVDPFAGSGSTGVASLLTGRNFLGFDVEQKALDFFRKTLETLEIPGDDPIEEPSEPTGGIFEFLT